MNSKATNSLNFNSNLFNLRDKLLRDFNLQQNIYKIKHRSINTQLSIKCTSYPSSLTSTISSLPKKTISSNSVYKTTKVVSLRDSLLSSRINFHRIQSKEIERNNSYFKTRLTRISSPLSRKKMNDSYFRFQKYEQISKKVKLSKENKKREAFVLRKLPMIYIRGNKLTSY